MTRNEAKDFLKALPGETAIMSVMRLRDEAGADAYVISITCERAGETASHVAALTSETLGSQFSELRAEFLDQGVGKAL